MFLKDKNIVITGAAGGIGSVVSKMLTDKGASLAMIDLSEGPLTELLDRIKIKNSNSFYLVADISNQKEIEEAFEKINSVFLSIDALINIAGIQSPIGNFIDNDLTQWKKNLDINLLGSVCSSHLALKSMVKNKKGKIINFSGGGSTSSRPSFSAYAVAKTGIVRFTEILAEELREFNIDVNAVAPGAINTKMLDEVLLAGKASGRELEDAIKRKEQGGDSANLVAELVCFLASEDSNGITGKLISAPWDPWREESFLDELRKNKDIATLRRIDNKTFYKKS